MRYSERQGEKTEDAEADTEAVQRVGKETLSGQIRRRVAGPGQTADPGSAFAQATSTPSQEIPFRGDMERSFGQDFSGVQAHVGGDARGGLGQLGALAAAQGEQVAFADASPSRETVAHELTHVVQSRGGQDGVHNKSAVSDPGDAAEVEADQVASRVVAGEPAQVSAAPSAGIHRIPDPTPAAPAGTGGGGLGAGPTTLANPAPNINLSSVFVAFTIPGNSVLQSDFWSSISSTSPTTIRITASATGISVRCSPPIFIDARWPASDMKLYGAQYDFASGAVTVNVYEDDDSYGVLDRTQDVRTSVTQTITQGLAGTPAAAHGYNPLTDPNIQQTLQAIATSFQSQPAHGAAAGGLGPANLSNVSAGGTFSVGTAIDVGSGDGSVHIAAGSPVTVEVNGGGTLAALTGAATPEAAAEAAQIQSIHITSNGIQVMQGTSPVAELREATIDRGGQVHLQQIHLLGAARTAEGIEALVRLFAVAMQAHDEGAPDNLAFALGAQGANPTIVDGITRDMIEQKLTEGVQQMVRANAHAIPGIDMMQVFGVAAAPAAPAGGAPPRH